MAAISVEHAHADRFLVRIRGHELIVDQPVGSGGDDLGPTPTELFVAGLAACVGFYAERFLVRHGLPTEGLSVESRFELSETSPARVSWIGLHLLLPDGVPDERREVLRRVVERCTVHNSLREPPDIAFRISERAAVERHPSFLGRRRTETVEPAAVQQR